MLRIFKTGFFLFVLTFSIFFTMGKALASGYVPPWLQSYSPGNVAYYYVPAYYVGGYYPSSYSSSSSTSWPYTHTVGDYVNSYRMKANTPVVMTEKQLAVYKAKPVQKVLW